MREIKFRAWDKTHRVMHYQAEQKLAVWLSVVEGLSQTISEDEDEQLEDRVELMQFTGLKDKNGKECYHKDIITDNDANIYVMEWDEKRAEFYLKLIKGVTGFSHLSASLVKEREIIGNIYENPELLSICPECGESRPADERVKVLGKCWNCAYPKAAA